MSNTSLENTSAQTDPSLVIHFFFNIINPHVLDNNSYDTKSMYTMFHEIVK